MKKKSSIKNDIILIILFFLIPIISLNLSIYFLANIDINWQKKEQEKKAKYEVETLASEADFSIQFSTLFLKYFNSFKSDINVNFDKDTFNNRQTQIANKIFKKPFPQHYSIYLFKLDKDKNNSELLFSKSDNKIGNRVLCKTFEHLYHLNYNDKTSNLKLTESFTKKFFGEITDINIIAKEKRGIPTHSNGLHSFSWFVWDYLEIENKEIYGAFLLCSQADDYKKAGKELALRNLNNRKIGLGAFLPLYKGYGDPILQYPLEKSDIFSKWSQTITIQKEEEIENWLYKDLPQDVNLGNYRAFCYLGRGSDYISVLLVKKIKNFVFPKWLIFFNSLCFFILAIILYLGLFLGIWIKISLTIRFVFSYLLASMLPLSIFLVTAYSYILQYKNTSIETAINKLQNNLKTIDSQKISSLKSYREAFTEALNEIKLIEEIKEKGINDEAVAQVVVRIFEKKHKLPIMGVKIVDEIGEGIFLKGTASSSIDIKKIFKSFNFTLTKILRERIKEDDPNADDWLKKEDKIEQDILSKNINFQMEANSIDKDLNTRLSIPTSRKNGDYCLYQILDFIKINNKTRYILIVFWDDKTIDNKIIVNAIYNNKDVNQNLAAFEITGQKVTSIKGNETNNSLTRYHGKEKFINKLPEFARIAAYSKKTDTFLDDDNLVVVMPALHFKQKVFIGWIDRYQIDKNINYRMGIFIILLIISLVILIIFSKKSSSIFLNPISALKSALDEVSLGNLNIKLENSPNNELGKLANEFSIMINGLSEKERLAKLISEQAVQALQKRSNGLLNDTENFDGVALVSDIRNFTGMSETYEPILITDLLNEHFAEMAKIISDNGGLIYKFIGDAIEAVFPEKENEKESASERAFKAGCLMIYKLKQINKNRKIRNLFEYRIGVGLAYGKLYSGTVGSIETRLDYTIIGEPLKFAAKLEALSIYNHSFPLVIDNNLANRIKKLNLGLNKLDIKDKLFYEAYILDNKDKTFNNYFNSIESFAKAQNIKNELDTNKNENIKVFPLQKEENKTFSKIKYFYSTLTIIFFSLIITLGFNIMYSTSYYRLKSESDVECNRLNEQLKSDDAFKASFEILSAKFIDDISKILNSKDLDINIEKSIKNLDMEYKNNGYEIPFVHCVLFNEKENEIIGKYSKGFSPKISDNISLLAQSIKSSEEAEIKTKYLQEVMGKSADAKFLYSDYYRRSCITRIEKKNLWIYTDRLYLDKQENKQDPNMIAFVFLAMPKELEKLDLLKYYTISSSNNVFLAINKDKEWYFSKNFSEKEKVFLKTNTNNQNDIINKGYIVEDIENKEAQGNDIDKANKIDYTIYSITKDLSEYYISQLDYSLIIFFICFIILFNFNKIINKFKNNIGNELRFNILFSAFLPLLVVIFLSGLYLNEDINIKKSEMNTKINETIDTTEARDFYFLPYTNYLLKEQMKSQEFQNILKASDEKDNEINDRTVFNQFHSLIKKEGSNDKYLNFNFANLIVLNKNGNFYNLETNQNINLISLMINKNNKYILNKEIRFDKNIKSFKDFNELDSLKAINKLGNKEENFSTFLAKITKRVYFSKNNNTNNIDNSNIKDGLIIDEILEFLTSFFGGDIKIELVNYPNNCLPLSVSFTTIAPYIHPEPSITNPEYIMVAMIFYNHQILSKICNNKNNKIPLEEHVASGSIGEEIYTYYSPNALIGERFFYNVNQDLNVVKELLNASYWLNSSFVPVSRKTDLYGGHYLIARSGRYVEDRIFAGIGSIKSVYKKVYSNIPIFSIIIIISLILIYFITQIVISDLLAPVNQLIIGAKSASNANYSYRTTVNRNDELSELCFSFNNMMKGLEEKQLMNSMVSKTALSVSSKANDVSSKKIDAVLLYITVPNFDKIMEETFSFELFTKLKKQIAIISEIVLKAGGDIDKIMGEKLLVVFRLGEKPLKEVAISACKAALEIEKNDSLDYKVSVGVNYGKVISGFLGVGAKRDFTIIGDPVNIAARIAVFAEKLEFNRCMISEDLYSIISKDLSCKEYGKVSLKGKSELMKVYQLD